MSWNYRIIEYNYIDSKETVLVYKIHEVYYNKFDEITAYSKEPIAAYGEDTVEELRMDIKLMLEAFDRPILNKDELDKKFGKT